jgi:hypothetical protein
MMNYIPEIKRRVYVLCQCERTLRLRAYQFTEELWGIWHEDGNYVETWEPVSHLVLDEWDEYFPDAEETTLCEAVPVDGVEYNLEPGWRSIAYEIALGEDDDDDDTKALYKIARQAYEGDNGNCVLTALWTVNRWAKRYRDMATEEYASGRKRAASVLAACKRNLYRLKGQALHYLTKDGQVTPDGHHLIGSLPYEVLRGGEFVFHRPASLGEVKACDIPERSSVEVQPQDEAEYNLSMAVYVLETYLDGKPEVEVYEHPAPDRRRSWKYDEEWDDEDWNDDEEGDDYEWYDDEERDDYDEG